MQWVEILSRLILERDNRLWRNALAGSRKAQEIITNALGHVGPSHSKISREKSSTHGTKTRFTFWF